MGGKAAMNTQPVGHNRLVKIGLSAGYVAVAVGVLIAHSTPARTYELSIYAATPEGFWLGVGVAIAVVLAVFASRSFDDRVRWLAVSLAGIAILAIVALPLIRSYYLYGGADTLTHIGWVKDFVSGTMNPWELPHPGIHLIAILISGVTGVPLRRGLVFVLAIFALVYFLFVPLTVREISGGRSWVVEVGAFSAFLLLPINNISTHLYPHPISQAILFSPLIFYLALRYIDPGPADGYWADTGNLSVAFGVLLATSSVALVLIHPQQAVSMVALLVVWSLVHWVYRSALPEHPLSSHRPLYGQTAFLGLVTVVWSYNQPAIRDVVAVRIQELWRFLTRSGEVPVGQAVGTRGESVSQIGSLPEIFAKLYFVEALFIVLALVLIGVDLFMDSADRPYKVKARYLVAGTVPIVGFFALFFVGGNLSTDSFRYSGFIMAIVTILSSVGLAYWFRMKKPSVLHGVSSAVLGALLILSLLVFFSSPHIFQPSNHVTKMEMEGHATAFDHRSQKVEFAGIREGPWRYGHAVDGTVGGEDQARYTGVSGDVLEDGLVHHYDTDHYLIVTLSDRNREIGAYRGLRYSRESFRTVRNSPGINRVQSNGGFVLYHVDSGHDSDE